MGSGDDGVVGSLDATIERVVQGDVFDDEQPGTSRGRVSQTPQDFTLSTRRRPQSPTSASPRRVVSERLRLSQRREEPSEREWTLFGQRMENEGQLKTPERKMNRRPSRLRLRDDRDIISTSNSAQGTIRESAYETDSVVQSPAEDFSMAASLPDPTLPPPRPESPETLHEPTIASKDYDSDDSDDSDSSGEIARRVLENTKTGSRLTSGIPTIPVLWRNILKCAVAYFLASLFTFSPFLSGLISDIASNGTGDRRPSPAGHMVATVAVYFNPAKTAGAMVEADTYCLLGLSWAAFICLGSMSMFWPLELSPGWEWLADIFVILWIGIGMTAVAWMKVWMAKPSFNTACSMTAIILFVVVVKEGGIDTLMHVAFVVLMGVLVANVVCFTLWPQTATANLQENMIKTLDSFSTLLSMLTNTFLLGDSSSLHQPSQGRLQRAVENHQASFTSLKKDLTEAHSERLFGGPGKADSKLDDKSNAGLAYEDAVDSLNRLAQHLNGLRSGTRLQYELTKALQDGKVVLKRKAVDLRMQQNTLSQNLERENGKGKATDNAQHSEEDAMLRAAAVIFGELVDELGPPLSALSTTCTSTLKRLREAFAIRYSTSPKTQIEPEEFVQLSEDIERALFTFESTSNHAVMRIYRRSSFSSARNSQLSLVSLDEGGGNNETVFLVYFFIFTLQEFAKELTSLVDAMGRIYSIEHAHANRFSRWKQRISAFFQFFTTKLPKLNGNSYRNKKRPPLRTRISTYLKPNPHRKKVVFPKVRPHAPNTIQTPARANLTYIGRVKQSLWSLGAKLKERNIKYSIKAGMATAMLAAPAFFDSTRPWFVAYKGEWALISFFVVISPTIGATNFLSLHRVLGTLLGAVTAVTAFTVFPENPVALSIFGFFFSIPCFYYIVAKPVYATSGRFVLLTYNLTCLYCYNLREKDVSVLDIAYHRSTAVTIGVVWAGLVSRFWWPSEARRELGNALSEFCLNIGWLYTHLVAANSARAEAFLTADSDDLESDDGSDAHGAGPDAVTERSSLLPKSSRARLSHSIRTFMAMELHLQIKLIELQGLLAQTQHEPRLKGPFPVKLYRSILTSLQTILDKLHTMRCVTTREENDFILPVNNERREMVGNVILYFSVLSSAFKLKAPLPPYLPPAEKSRQRLVEAIRNLDVVKHREVKGSRQLLFFAYALTMQGVCQELDYLGRTLQDAFGVIGQTVDEFEAFFISSGARNGSLV
ncbi:hypothetical protein BD410DRAFT_789429 [Rickenella mellea]|uniref:Uncharacterized protein n=1 Tax=Rickenella mellea TaxID=50990 RepID=A0A4Y7Q4D6_9AGAM|nr:hypothetical protein BD410DRAFT_789429 [Rickenella mellea]